MTDSVNVQSIPALADFRAALATFGEAVNRVLDECDLEVRRTVQWVMHDAPAFWRAQVRRAMDDVAFARNDLNRAEQAIFDGQRPTCYQQKKALEAAKTRLRRAEEKMEAVRRHAGTIQKETGEYAVRMAQLREVLCTRIPVAMALLGRMIDALEAYAALEAPEAYRPVQAAPAVGLAPATSETQTGVSKESRTKDQTGPS
ncbi:MAG: hypothetical protein HYS13_02330 [Planctomycetia bacterium]|nr:hypothetical protein [Planctomycetia bacterium]